MTRTDKIYTVIILLCAVLAIISLIKSRPDFICLFMGIGTLALCIWPENNKTKENKDEQQTSDSSKA